MKSGLLAGLAVMLMLGCGPAPEESGGPSPMAMAPEPSPAAIQAAARDFDEVRAGFLEWYMEAHPVRATELGVHDFDGRLPALDRVGVQDRIDDLLEWLADVEQIPFTLMRDENRYDYAVLEYAIREELLELEETRVWVTDPGLYTDVIARGVAVVAEHAYAPLSERLLSLEARMGAAGGVLDAARSNVQAPPRLWTELAIEDTRGLIEYVEQWLPERLAAQAGDSIPLDGVDAARSQLVERLESHATWLQETLLPRSTGSYRLGRYLLERKLLYGEHVSLELEELERLNADAITEYREKVEAVAREIDPERSPRAIMDSISRERPAPDSLVPTAREMTAAARDWVVESGVVPVPRDEVPEVRETQPFARHRFSWLDAPGPFERRPLQAVYRLTNVRPDWDRELQQEYLRHFNRGALMATTLHETFPGRYVQWQYARDLRDVRRVFTSSSFSAGWAHYAAEMALEEGFSEDPAVLLGQYQRALQRQARWYAVIRLHALDEQLDDVVAAFMEIAYMPEYPARREVVRATRDPEYMADALGRMQILELREDYQEHLEDEDETFTLADFHQRLLRLGLPFPLAREALMPPEEPRRRPR